MIFLKKIVFLLLIVFSFSKLGATHFFDDSLIIQQRINEAAEKLIELRQKNQELIQLGRQNELKFVVILNDRISDTVLAGTERFLTEENLEQKLNDSLQRIYFNHGLETYVVFANYHELKIKARLPNNDDSLNIKELFGENTWYDKNSNINELETKSELIYKGVLAKVSNSLNSNFVLLKICRWKIQYLQNKGKIFYTYRLGYNIPNASATNSEKTLQYYNNIQNAFEANNNLRYTGSRNVFAKNIISALSRSALQVYYRNQLLLSTNSTEAQDILDEFNADDYNSLNVKERLHVIRLFIRGVYNEPTANRIIGFVPNQFINPLYDSLKLNYSVAGQNKSYLKFIIDKTDGDDLDELFKYFVQNFPYYYNNKASQYTNESSYEILNLTTNPFRVGDCEISEAVVNDNATMLLKYKAITDVTTSYAYRQTTDNTNVTGVAGNTSVNIDYCLAHPDDCIETRVKVWEDFPENTTIDPYFPVLVSYEGDDEDISGTLPASQSALVPAMYLYYLNNEQEKAQLQENISNAVEITVTTIAIVGTDGAAAPLFLGGTRFAATAIKVYRAANYVSLGLAITDWGTESPEIAELRNKYGLLMAAVDLPDLLTTAPKAWRSVKKLAHNSKTSIIAIGKVSKVSAVDFYTALKNCGNQLSQLPEATRNKVMKLYYYLRKQRLLDDVVSGTVELVRGIKKTDFLNTVGDFANGANAQLADQAWDLWRQEKWSELENLFKANNINFDQSIQNVWPPMFGFKNLTNMKQGAELDNLVFDRFQKEASLGGGYASPVPTNNSVFSLQSRALGVNYDDLIDLGQDYYYYKFKIVNPPADLSFKYGEAAPWFNEIGGALQIKSSKGFHNLSTHIEIIEKWQFSNGQWIKIL